MNLLLVVAALFIAFIYGFYSLMLLRGKSAWLEENILHTIGDSVREKNMSVRLRNFWMQYTLSLLLEMGYLVFSYMALNNWVFRSITSAIFGINLFLVFIMQKRIWLFYHKKLKLSQLFIWKFEHLSALALFSHALLVLLYPLITWH